MAKRKKLTPAELRKVSEQIVELASRWGMNEPEDAVDRDGDADQADQEKSAPSPP